MFENQAFFPNTFFMDLKNDGFIRKTEREKESFHLLAHSANACKRTKPGVGH